MHDLDTLLALVLGAPGPAAALRRLDEYTAELRRRQETAPTAEAVNITLAIAAAEPLRSSLLACQVPVVDTPPILLPANPPTADADVLDFLGRGVSGRLSDHHGDLERV